MRDMQVKVSIMGEELDILLRKELRLIMKSHPTSHPAYKAAKYLLKEYYS